MSKLNHFSIKFFIILIPIVGLIVLITLNTLLRFSSDVKKFPSIKKCRDWHDYDQMRRDRERSGFGENGTAAHLTDADEIAENERLYEKTGFSVIVSNKISLNRSIPDYRAKECHNLTYPSYLPSVSIIIIFHNEVKSVLLRTIHSIVNRTPLNLIHEIILVNDCSTNDELYEPLQKYVRETFKHTKIRIKNLKERKGLIVTRLEGALIAQGEILVFFDSHVEVNQNWLPPLLAPIKANSRIATMPVIDNFEPDTFSTYGDITYGTRGGIDWKLIYHPFPRYFPPGINPIKPFPQPIMLGCAFAIDRKFFLYELDGYDREFKIWNAENYELSFKLWLCADGLFEIPCSRITHSFRRHNPSRISTEDYVGRNFKRLIEVWLDDYKQYIYSHDPERYKNIDVGDLTRVKAVRQRLKCKNFKYYLEEIAPDFLERYPLEQQVPVFASGQIISLKHENICVDQMMVSEFDPIGLYVCANAQSESAIPQTQFFRLTFMKNINLGYEEHCLDSFKMSMPNCHYSEFGNQYWKYDHHNNMLINSYDDAWSCLTGNFTSMAIYMDDCDENNEDQKWKFTYENKTALDDWKNIYGYKKFIYQDREVKKDKMLPMEYDQCNWIRK